MAIPGNYETFPYPDPYHFETIPLPACSKKCCNTTFGPIDYAFFFFETIFAVGTALAGVRNDYEEGATFLGSFICFTVGHCLVRKYGNIANLISRFNQTQQNFQTTYRQQLGEIHTLNLNTRTLTEENTAIKLERDRFIRENQEFSGKLIDQTNALSTLQAANQKLTIANEQLTQKVADLEKLNDSLQVRIHDFSEQNRAFYKEIQQVAAAIPSLKTAVIAIQKGGAIVEANATYLEEEVHATHLLIQQIIEGLKKNQMDLLVQLSALENERGKLQEEIVQLQEEKKRFQSASETAQMTIDQLTKIQAALEQKINIFSRSGQNLQEETHALSDLVHDLHQTMGTNLEAATAALHNTEGRLAHAAELEKDADAEIAEQLKESM